MGTRADFYVGRGEDAEWLGSIAWDGYPSGTDDGLLSAASEKQFRHHLARFLSTRDDATLPEMGWPWPWETSHTTDFAYAFDDGRVWGSSFGAPWFEVDIAADGYGDPEWEDEKDLSHLPPTVFPNMSTRRMAVVGSKRSGVMTVSLPPEPPA